jgi:hypothetical protein
MPCDEGEDMLPAFHTTIRKHHQLAPGQCLGNNQVRRGGLTLPGCIEKVGYRICW